MAVDIRFCTTSAGVRIAYTRFGRGPALVFSAWWINHLEVLMEHPSAAAFFAALARHRTVVLYDRHGAGLSDRNRTDFTLAAELCTLTDLLTHLGLTRCALFGFSQGGPTAIAYAAAHPQQVTQLILCGTGARTGAAVAEVPSAVDRTWDAVSALVDAHWGVGALALSKWLFPGSDSFTHDWLARFVHASATPRMAIDLSRSSADVEALLPGLLVPTLVLSRREDNTDLFERGRRLAARIPHARFVPLEGAAHLFFLGDFASILQAILPFLDDETDAPHETAQPDAATECGFPNGLTAREAEVLALLAAGLRTREISVRLVISTGTVERHIANLYHKIGAHGRADAATYALRHGLLVMDRR